MIGALFFLVMLWYGLAALLSIPFLPFPHTVFLHMIRLFTTGNLAIHLLVSAYRVTLALVSCALGAFVLGVASGRVRSLNRVLSPVTSVLYPIPKVALLPLIMLFFGIGDLSKILLIALIIFFQLFVVVRDATHLIDERYIDSIRSIGAKRRDVIVHVLIPALLPTFFTALRVSTGTAIAILFLAENFATVTGIGWFITDSWARMNYVDMYAGIVTLSLLGSLFFFLFFIGEKLLCSWVYVQKNRR